MRDLALYTKVKNSHLINIGQIRIPPHSVWTGITNKSTKAKSVFFSVPTLSLCGPNVQIKFTKYQQKKNFKPPNNNYQWPPCLPLASHCLNYWISCCFKEPQFFFVLLDISSLKRRVRLIPKFQTYWRGAIDVVWILNKR